MSTKKVGVTDVPINILNKEDSLNVGKYVKGLTDFIKNCETPMTIALQGDWGTGKTSFINLIDEQIHTNERQVKTLKFNTWKYAQFNQEQNLHISFLGFLISELLDNSVGEILRDALNDSAKGKKEVTEKEKKRRSIMWSVLSVATPVLMNSINAFALDGAIPLALNGGGSASADSKDSAQKLPFDMSLINQFDSARIIESLRNNFQDAINSSLTDDQGNPIAERVIIFIDDLDRLEPRLAVKLLEIIKLFLDVDNCVFVLAIDYEVVIQGLLERFKNDTPEVARAKAQSFFDKMIQVPFHIPTHSYRFNDFIFDNLKDKNRITNKESLYCLENILLLSVGDNPRAVKRLLNSFYLISSIAGIEQDDKKTVYLLATLCMQLSYAPAYRYFIGKVPNIDGETDDIRIDFEDLIDFNEETLTNIQSRVMMLNEVDIDRNLMFVEALAQVISKLAGVEISDDQTYDDLSDDDKKKLDDEMKIFVDVLAKTKITDEKNAPTHVTIETRNITLEEFMSMPSKERSNLKVKSISYNNESFEQFSSFVRKYEEVLNKISEDYVEELPKWSDTLRLLEIGVLPRYINESVKEVVAKNPEGVNAVMKKPLKTYPDNAYFTVKNTNFKVNKHYGPDDLTKYAYPVLKYIHEEIPSKVYISVSDRLK